MAGTEYTLTGFDCLAERQRVVFVEPLPSARVCGVCGLVPKLSLLLPCGHALCQVCRDQIPQQYAKCPLDDGEFVEADVVRIIFKKSYMEQQRVLCVAGGRECSFAGVLSDLKEHLVGCGKDKVRCTKCRQSLVRSVAVEHYQRCSAEAPTPVNANIFNTALAVLNSVMDDLESVRERESSEDSDQDTAVNSRNSLAVRITELKLALLDANKEANGGECSSLLLALNRAAVTPGPYRSASKHGNFIATCRFSDVYDGNEPVHEASSEVCTLAGYTFRLYLLYQRAYVPTVTFTFCFCEGGWDVCVEWPFSKKATLIVTHPTCMEKDIKLPFDMKDGMRRKPGPGCEQREDATGATREVSWNCIEQQGFVVNNALYVNVEFESRPRGAHSPS